MIREELGLPKDNLVILVAGQTVGTSEIVDVVTEALVVLDLTKRLSV